MKKIPLSQGKFALVDDEDYQLVNQFKWYAWRNKKRWYAVRNLPAINGIRKSIKMHRFILGILDTSIQVDHKNHNGLDNQRHNIRSCVNAQNSFNQGKTNKGRTSKYKGVSVKKYYTGAVRWISQIVIDGKKTHLGCFKTQREAATAYNSAAKKHHGEFANLNKINS